MSAVALGSREWYVTDSCSEGTGRMTLFAASGNARTYDYQVSPWLHRDTQMTEIYAMAQAGDVGKSSSILSHR